MNVFRGAKDIEIAYDLSREEQLGLVKENPWHIIYIGNPHKDVCLNAVKADGEVLKYIENQTEEICLAAVKQSPMALMYVKEQTEKICLEAVKADGYALNFVKNQTEEMCLVAVKSMGVSLKYVKDQTEEICLIAVKNSGIALEYVRNQTEEICLAALEQTGFAFRYIKEPTKNIYWKYVNSPMFSIKHVKNYNDKEFFKYVLNKKYLNITEEEYDKLEMEDFKKYAFFLIGGDYIVLELQDKEDKYLNSLNIMSLSVEVPLENNFLDYLIELNKGFSFIVNNTIDESILKKLILSNNYVVFLKNPNEEVKLNEKLYDYVVDENVFYIDDDAIPF